MAGLIHGCWIRSRRPGGSVHRPTDRAADSGHRGPAQPVLAAGGRSHCVESPTRVAAGTREPPLGASYGRSTRRSWCAQNSPFRSIGAIKATVLQTARKHILTCTGAATEPSFGAHSAHAVSPSGQTMASVGTSIVSSEPRPPLAATPDTNPTRDIPGQSLTSRLCRVPEYYSIL
jgi:hypothetical protein